MRIHFVHGETVDSDDMTFYAICDGRKIRCRIARETLDDYFEGDIYGIPEAFSRQRPQIEAIAKRRIEKQWFEADGSILIPHAAPMTF